MSIVGCKRGREHTTTKEEREDDMEDEKKQLDHITAIESILELPIHLVYDILSRLDPKTIFCCRCVCKAFLKILIDPYFAKVHLIKASDVAASLILQDTSIPSGFVFAYMLDLEETSSTSSSSNHQRHRSHPFQALAMQNTKFQFYHGKVTLVGSCNGLLCLHLDSRPKSLYYICNPILGEFMVLPQFTPLTPGYIYLNHSGFGFCPKTGQYKVIRFMCKRYSGPIPALLSRKTVAEIHTLGTESWRRIGDAPWFRTRGSLDSFLNGILHWITDSATAANLISSFDLETEQLQPVPAPTHFNPDYINKISWINVGVLRGYLCICYVHGDAQFDVWVMKDYGIGDSWTKEFAIDIKFYCGLRVECFRQLIKFLNNGDLLLISNSSLVSYSPWKGTFRDLKAFGTRKLQVIAHVPSFISLKNIANGISVKSVKWENWAGLGLTGNFVLTE